MTVLELRRDSWSRPLRFRFSSGIRRGRRLQAQPRALQGRDPLLQILHRCGGVDGVLERIGAFRRHRHGTAAAADHQPIPLGGGHGLKGHHQQRAQRRSAGPAGHGPATGPEPEAVGFEMGQQMDQPQAQHAHQGQRCSIQQGTDQTAETVCLPHRQGQNRVQQHDGVGDEQGDGHQGEDIDDGLTGQVLIRIVRCHQIVVI
jgi:hypothetical protein